MKTQFVSAADMETLEHYAASLVTAMVTLRTLETFQCQAIRIGILDADEIEMAKTIAWELNRLMKLYQGQTSKALERANIDPTVLIDQFHKNSLEQAKEMVKGNKKR